MYSVTFHHFLHFLTLNPIHTRKQKTAYINFLTLKLHLLTSWLTPSAPEDHDVWQKALEEASKEVEVPSFYFFLLIGLLLFLIFFRLLLSLLNVFN